MKNKTDMDSSNVSRAQDWQNYFLTGVFFIVLCLTFIDLWLALIMLTGSSFSGILIYFGLIAFLLPLQLFFLLKRRHSRYVYLYLAISFWQILIYLTKGYSLSYVIQAFSNDGIFLIYLAWFETGRWTRRGIIKVFLAVASVHIIFVILEFLGITSQMVDQWTLYGDRNTQFGYRFTGLFNAPGVLALFSAFMAVYGAVDYKMNREYLGLTLFFIALFLGIASGNRSFLLATILGLLAVYVWRPRFPNYKKTKKINLTYMLAFVILAVITLWYVYQDEIQFILIRFQWEALQTDIYTRTQGYAGFLPALKSLGTASSIFGTTSIDPEFGNNRVFFDSQSYSLSNSYTSLLVTKGWLFGGAYLMLYIGAFMKYRRFSKSYVYSELSVIGSCLYFAMFTASIVLLFDNLIEGIMMTTCFILAYSRIWRQVK